MPAIFTHIQFGKEVIATLPPSFAFALKKYPQCFYLGTQGPDLLFYHKPFKKKKNPARQKGWDLHAQSPEKFFLNAAKLLQEEGLSSPLAAYVIGFLCHFTLDKECHPFIDAQSVNGLTHGKIESELDKATFKRVGLPPRGFNAATLFFPEEQAKAVSAKVLDVTEENTQTAMRSMRKINALFSNKRGAVHGFCHAALTLVGQNKGFGQMFLHKKEDERFQPLLPVLEEKFQAAIPKAAALIEEFFTNLPQAVAANTLTNDFYRYNYSGIKEE